MADRKTKVIGNKVSEVEGAQLKRLCSRHKVRGRESLVSLVRTLKNRPSLPVTSATVITTSQCLRVT